jgi:hypothetical protein
MEGMLAGKTVVRDVVSTPNALLFITPPPAISLAELKPNIIVWPAVKVTVPSTGSIFIPVATPLVLEKVPNLVKEDVCMLPVVVEYKAAYIALVPDLTKTLAFAKVTSTSHTNNT